MSRVINSVITQAAERLGSSLEQFYPSYGRNGLNERNLTYQIAKAFESRSNACAFMEVPFLNTLSGRYDFRIDCMLFDSERVIFIESKRLYKPEKLEQLIVDFQRMNLDNLSPVLEKFVGRARRSRKVYRMILAETWQAPIVDWWVTGSDGRSWDHSWLPDDRGAIEVMTFENGKTLSWLYAYEELQLPVDSQTN